MTQAVGAVRRRASGVVGDPSVLGEPSVVTDEARTAWRRANAVALFWATIWLFWMISPFIDALRRLDTPAGVVGALAAPAFSAVYVWHFMQRRSVFFQIVTPRLVVQSRRSDFARYLLLGALAAVCVICVGQSGYTAAVFFALSALWTMRPAPALTLVAAVAVLYVVLWHTQDWESDWGALIGLGFGSAAITAGRLAGNRQRQLRASELVNADLMVQQERNRMARDLHDILGHSLTVITVKSELAGRLLDAGATERARAELADLEQLSRTALGDVRRAVEGYREISLAGELARAREALAAADIQLTAPSALDVVPEDLVEVFAWTVRESVTNVLRHSRATHCTIEVTPTFVSVSDDGRGPVGDCLSGNGLRGLRERAAASGAVLVTSAAPAGGFIVTVAVQDAAGRALPADVSDRQHGWVWA